MFNIYAYIFVENFAKPYSKFYFIILHSYVFQIASDCRCASSYAFTSCVNGRPGIYPVMLMKYLLMGYLYGIESEWRIEQEVQVNMAYRWFLGLDIGERVPDHSTISQNRRRRFNRENVFRRLFERVLEICMEKGLVEENTRSEKMPDRKSAVPPYSGKHF